MFILAANGAEGIGEKGGSGSMEDKASRSDGVKESSVLTEAMLNEEQRLHDAESRESSSEREKVTLENKCSYNVCFFHLIIMYSICLPLHFFIFYLIAILFITFLSPHLPPPLHYTHYLINSVYFSLLFSGFCP